MMVFPSFPLALDHLLRRARRLAESGAMPSLLANSAYVKATLVTVNVLANVPVAVPATITVTVPADHQGTSGLTKRCQP